VHNSRTGGGTRRRASHRPGRLGRMHFNSHQKLRDRLQPVLDLIHRQDLVEQLVERQEGKPGTLASGLVQRRHREALASRLRRLHPADIAHLVEMLPPDERSLVWKLVPEDAGGEVLVEVVDSVAEGLIEETPPDRLMAMCSHLDPADLSFLEEFVSPEVRERILRSLEGAERSWVEASFTYPEDSVGALMSRDHLVIREDATVRDTLKYLRGLDVIPDQSDQIFVVDARQHLVGVLPITTLLLHSPRQPVAEIMESDVVAFTPEDAASAAGAAFERYDLVSAPVVDSRDRLLGRVTVEVMMQFIREEVEEDMLNREGLRGDEDLFGPILTSARGRWLWLAVNLLTAFLASRVIGVFEGTIQQLVALATLMPIVASIGGNTGNQTMALVVRGLALDQINRNNVRYLAVKELAVALINGALWGTVMGMIAWGLYGNQTLGLVMGAATLLNLIVAAAVGIGVPLGMRRAGRDPALGSSVVLTFVTDCMGFFIFLGLATILLI
jgi:magnesium transporter